MIISIFLLVLSSVFSSSSPYHPPRCSYGDPCWPSPATWQAFNASISGHLLAPFPPAAVCHNPRYNDAQCKIAKAEWRNSLWRTNQTGAYAAILWEMGDEQCFIDAPRTAPCEQGLVPRYAVAAREVEDVQKAVRFAAERNLYLVVKNTGHDQYVPILPLASVHPLTWSVAQPRPLLRRFLAEHLDPQPEIPDLPLRLHTAASPEKHRSSAGRHARRGRAMA